MGEDAVDRVRAHPGRTALAVTDQEPGVRPAVIVSSGGCASVW